MNELISIILPVKDTSIYLEECINSIIRQHYPHWELIAVNDGSSDNSLQILESFAKLDNRIRVLDNPSPSLINALKLGFKESTGDYITRMDSDDKMPEDKLQSMMYAWQSNGKGSLITGGVKYFSDEELGDGYKRYADWINNLAKDQTYLENKYRECVIPSCCWLIHRDDFTKAGGFESEIYPEDYDLCFRFINQGLNIIGIDKTLHYWRDHPERISRNLEVYQDHRFFDLKLSTFLAHDRDKSRPLVLWGAGKNGKKIAKFLKAQNQDYYWICDNKKKIGKDIYGQTLKGIRELPEISNPQIIIAVANKDDQQDIEVILKEQGLHPIHDFWFFS